ncbi:hypothetical protein [uncultured Thiodictyon sp.]|jgi:hypothetical protein|uniref:hypothetical protein n=1 Tax=uncultured Thiodictyon sp. TaxID=1846217 RepID=UPI0025F36702|nr:hypothetical protein [uncultured Thiodictyon sp.]
MPVSSATDCPCVRRGRLRLAGGALALLSGLGAGPASAVPLEIDSFTWSSNNGTYNDYAGTCPNVGGSDCGGPPTFYPPPGSGYSTTRNRSDQSPATPADGTIFSWGTISDTAYQTKLEWINNEENEFTLATITLKGPEDPANGKVGTGMASWITGSAITTLTGQDAVPPWEWGGQQVRDTEVGQARIEISLRKKDSSQDTVLYTGVVFSQVDPVLRWFNGDADGNTRQTPINFAIDFATVLPGPVIVSAQDRIKIRLFETFWNGGGSGENFPDVQYTSLLVGIYDSGDVPTPAPATLALFGLGMALLRPWRRLNPAAPTATC